MPTPKKAKYAVRELVSSYENRFEVVDLATGIRVGNFTRDAAQSVLVALLWSESEASS